jgi:hypothetical protein
MSRDYYPDEYELERQHEHERRLEIEAEQEPWWMHQRLRNRLLPRNRPGPERRCFSRLMFQAINETAAEVDEEAA